MEYKLLTGSTSSISKFINKYLNEGWTLYGNTFKTGNKLYICQYQFESELGQVVIKDNNRVIAEFVKETNHE
jgi:hypothetical protein